ncbi:SRPBCC family protein [Pseudarthrobacter sp. P1]|uniref:SRPBCC family protein n=1 Tax=Pseudarthrobacter sp. P1 TaxID=3418418 RepID=UPI003CF42800
MSTAENTVDTLAREGESMVVDGTTLTIVRFFDAPREVLFEAWTDPDQLAQWWGPEHLHTPRDSVAIEAVVGGFWKASMVMDDGSGEFPAVARFTAVEPPSRLELHEPASEMFPFEITMKITFEDVDGRTRMTIVQHFATESFDFDDSVKGWGTSLEKLRRLAS